MHAPITYSEPGGRRSLLEERPTRPPIIGKIRPGIKVLTKAAREKPDAVKIHDRMLAQGQSFERIGVEISRTTGIKTPLVPKNVPWFTCRGSDFANPAVAEDIVQRYGEDRGDGNGFRLWRFPVIFAFDDWLSNMPNQLVAWTQSGRQFFSEYGPDGRRYCKMYAPPVRDARANRAKRTWGGRTIILRQDDDIPDGICDPHMCPQYQDGNCNLSASFYFALPSISGLGLIEMPTTSIYVLQKAHAAMQTVALARGRLVGVKFWMAKQEVEISRIDDSGRAVRQMQWLITLDAEIDIGALLDGSDRRAPAIEMATQAVAPLEDEVHPAEPAPLQGDEPPQQSQVVDTPAAHALPVDGEDLESQFEDLMARLGLANQEGRAQFRIYASATFGRGWTKRDQDVRQLLGEMRTALTNPLAFREQVAAIAAEVAP
ncbi:Recombination directionality factor-like (plasmid) [Cupriavidus necator]|uniref:recombination directionality factor n=1 Tax=Cupriavidus necator TaxID=106590 RepID=UPI003F73D295